MTKLRGFSPLVRKRIKERAGIDDFADLYVRCEGCGVWCSEGWYDLHHRIPRGSGGTKRAHVNQAANGLCLCRNLCHAWAESQRTEARDERGWLISQHRKDVTPSQVPVLLHDGWFLLDDHGGRWAVPNPHRESA